MPVNPPLKYRVSDAELDTIADYLHDRTGLRFKGARRRFLQTRVGEAAEAVECANVSELIERLRNEGTAPGTLQRIIDRVVTDESSFFRYPQQFDALRNFILPALASNRAFSNRKDRTIRILSAGCSRGQEPYSIAMACQEEAETLRGLDVTIYALDISQAALDRARAGIYSEPEIKDVPPHYFDAYFEPAPRVANGRGRLWRVTDWPRRMVRFQQHNLKHELSGPIFDIIFCRNVTIYFDDDDTRRVARNLYDRLTPGGYLFLGHAESYYGILPGLCTVQFGEALVNRKPVS